MAENIKKHGHGMDRMTTGDKIFTVCNYIFWVIVLLIVLYPLYLIVICSVSDPYAVMNGEVLLWPVDFSWIAARSWASPSPWAWPTPWPTSSPARAW